MSAAAVDVPTDPRMGVTLRAFVTAVANDLGVPVEGGSQRLRIEMIADDEGWTLRADGIGDVGAEPPGLPYRRVDLLMGLFPFVSVDGSNATIRSITTA